MNIPVVVDHARIARVHPSSVKPLEIASVEPLVVVEQPRKCGRCQRHRHDDVAHGSLWQFLPFVVHNPDVEPGHGQTCRPRSDLQWLDGILVVDGRLGLRDA